MKSTFSICIATVTLLVALAIPLRLTAQNKQDHKNAKHHHYQLIDLGTFGGPNSSFPRLNGPGAGVGWSATSMLKLPQSDPNICGGIDNIGSFITVAFQWQNGILTDLGALPGGSNCSMPFGLNAKGESAGESENGQFDPLVGFNQSRAVRWKDGRIEDLGSLGGNQNTAFYINNRGQIVGGSQNATPDPFSCWGPSSTQCRAFLWQHGKMQDLGTLGTGNDADAGYINERGQISGISYTSSTPNPITGIPPLDPYLWENGKMRDLGTLGGAYAFVNALNNRGQVIGGSSLAADPGACLGIGNTANCHPFLWSEGKLIDLNTTTIGGVPLVRMRSTMPVRLLALLRLATRRTTLTSGQTA